MVVRMSYFHGVDIHDIVFENMSNYPVGITINRPWKAKQIANILVEGDAAKQYNLFWRYSAELRRINSKNNWMINVVSVGTTIQPK